MVLLGSDEIASLVVSRLRLALQLFPVFAYTHPVLCRQAEGAWGGSSKQGFPTKSLSVKHPRPANSG